MFACAYGAAFGAIQHVPRIIPGLPEVKEKAKQAVEVATAGKPEADQKKIAAQTTARSNQAIAAHVTKIQEAGGLLGRFDFRDPRRENRQSPETDPNFPNPRSNRDANCICMAGNISFELA